MRRPALLLLGTCPLLACGLSIVGVDLTSTDAGVPDASSHIDVTAPIADAAITEEDAGPPTITIAGSAQLTAIDFSAEGTSDWVYWGTAAPFERKADGGTKIADYTETPDAAGTPVGPGTTMVWTDGTAPTPVNDAATGVEVWNAGPVFTFTVAALPTSQTLVLYVGGLNSDADFTAKIGGTTSTTMHASELATTTAQYTIRFAVTFSSPTPANLELQWSLADACDAGTCGAAGFFALNGATLAAP